MFGSFANGLSTWNSDLDLVVTGVFEPDRLTGGARGGRAACRRGREAQLGRPVARSPAPALPCAFPSASARPPRAPGYDVGDKGKVTARLRKILEALLRARLLDVTRQQLIPRARMPLLKVRARGAKA